VSTPPSPDWPRERCAERADRREDQMLGTAFPAARLLLVEEPFPWGSEGLRTSRFDRGIALALEARGRAEGVRVQAIRRPGATAPGARRQWVTVDTRDETPQLRRGEFGDPAELLELPLDGSPGDPDPDPLYLVCTHGKHDPCCAQRGRPVAAALDEVRPARVWQASHLGGCRFAPSVLVLPLGLMYGRVIPSAADEFIAAADAGEVVGRQLRGRIGVPPAAQAAIGFAHEQLSLPRSRDISLVSTTPVDGVTVRVRLRSPCGPLDVAVQRERVDAAGLTCAQPGASWFIAHRPVTIEPVADG
jgi:(2Fe-2S) ferredoxin